MGMAELTKQLERGTQPLAEVFQNRLTPQLGVDLDKIEECYIRNLGSQKEAVELVLFLKSGAVSEVSAHYSTVRPLSVDTRFRRDIRSISYASRPESGPVTRLILEFADGYSLDLCAVRSDDGDQAWLSDRQIDSLSAIHRWLLA